MRSADAFERHTTGLRQKSQNNPMQSINGVGEGAFAAEGIDQIATFLGNDFHRKLEPLVAPVDGRLFFAGEATSPGFFSTAHGARDSEERMAKEVLAAAKI